MINRKCNCTTLHLIFTITNFNSFLKSSDNISLSKLSTLSSNNKGLLLLIALMHIYQT